MRKFIKMMAWIGSFGIGMLAGYKKGLAKLQPVIKEQNDALEACSFRARLLYLWISIKEKDKSIAEFLQYNHVTEVAVYGYGIVGQMLIRELQKEQIQINYVIDKRAESITANVPIYTLEDELPDAKVLIVTTLNVHEIKNKLSKQIENIIELQDILNALVY